MREGANGIRDTRGGDDVVVGARIFEGANRQCDTTAAGDDVRWRPTGPSAGSTAGQPGTRVPGTGDRGLIHAPILQLEGSTPLYLS
jgi:hypothetical protein